MRSSLVIVSLFLAAALRPAAGQSLLYATSGGFNGLPAVVDPATNSIAKILQSGGISFFEALAPAGSRAYFTDPFGQVVTVVDTVNDTRLATIPMPDTPFLVAVNFDGTRLYVSMATALEVIDTATNTVIAEIPFQASVFSLAASRTSPRIYVGVGSTLWVIDTTTNMIVSSISNFSNRDILAIVPSPDGSRLYVVGRDNSDGSAGYLMTVDLNMATVIGSIPVGSYPTQLNVTPDGSRVYVSLQGAPGALAGALVRIDVASGQVTGAISVPGYGGPVAIEPDGTAIYVGVNEPLDNTVYAIDPATLAVTARITGFWAGVNALEFAPIRPIVNYEAEAPGHVLTGKTRVVACSVCWGGAAVAGVAEPGSGPAGGSLTITNVAGVSQPTAQLSVYYQHSERLPIRAAVIVNGVTNAVSFPPLPAGAVGPAQLVVTVPGANIGTVKITGVKGTPASSLTIDRITVQ